jgi:hypothetical protein
MSDHQNDPVEELKYERRDISVRAVAIFLVGIQLAMILCCVIGYGLHKGFRHWMRESMPTMSPLADFNVQAPAPRLQVDATEELEKYREEQAPLMATYGWIDTTSGIVRLPIARAKELLLERGLPARAESKS